MSIFWNFFTTDNIKPEENYLEKDLTIKLKDFEIRTNYIFTSLNQHKIRKSFQESKINSLNFSDFIFPHIRANILQIYEGIPFVIDEYDFDEVIATMVYLQVNFWKYDNLITSIEQFQRVLISPEFYVQKENQLFQIILDRIEEKSEFISLFQYLHFSIVNQNKLIDLISLLSFHQVDWELLSHIRDNFLFNYLIDAKKEDFDFHKCYQFMQEQKILQNDLNNFHQIPINLFPLNNIKIIEGN
jgi:hypothetical protein